MARDVDQANGPGSATRERILSAALDLVAERGLQSLTHRGVEERAGVSHGLTTYHFTNRDALIEALFTYTLERQLEWVTQLQDELAAARTVSPTVDPVRYVERAVATLVTERSLTLARYEMFLHAARTPHLQATAREIRQPFVAIFAEAFTAAAPDPLWAAHRLLSAVEGMLLFQISGPETEFDAWAAEYVVTIAQALSGAPSGPPANG
ncbi:TetR/AcrR family transcriptional regulator [Propionibacteriaceae bacterium Y2011]|uniref:TetR/AcrR family transcriptional regulator n=1 Tax=Microlunatus sp. Y2014 TaxID=3418488 RepID=UPI003B491FC2